MPFPVLEHTNDRPNVMQSLRPCSSYSRPTPFSGLPAPLSPAAPPNSPIFYLLMEVGILLTRVPVCAVTLNLQPLRALPTARFMVPLLEKSRRHAPAFLPPRVDFFSHLRHPCSSGKFNVLPLDNFFSFSRLQVDGPVPVLPVPSYWVLAVWPTGVNARAFLFLPVCIG